MRCRHASCYCFVVAPPNVFLIRPSVGSTGGRTLITIGASELRTTGDQPSVRVLFDGIESPRVDVHAESLLSCLTPAHVPGVVDVEVIKLDPDEATVVVGAFEFARPDLVVNSLVETIARHLLRRFREQVIENTVFSQDTDWDDFALDFLDRAAIAELPTVVLAGPRIPQNSFYQDHTRRTREEPDGSISVFRPAESVDLLFDLIFFVDSRQAQLRITELMFTNVNRYRQLVVEGIAYDLDIEPGAELRDATTPNNSNLRRLAGGAIIVRGVQINDAPGFEGDLIHRRVWPVKAMTTRVGP